MRSVAVPKDSSTVGFIETDHYQPACHLHCIVWMVCCFHMFNMRYMGINIGCICCTVIFTVTQSSDIQCCKQVKLRSDSMFQMGKT